MYASNVISGLREIAHHSCVLSEAILSKCIFSSFWQGDSHANISIQRFQFMLVRLPRDVMNYISHAHYRGGIDFNTDNTKLHVFTRDGLMMREGPYTASNRDELGCTSP